MYSKLIATLLPVVLLVLIPLSGCSVAVGNKLNAFSGSDSRQSNGEQLGRKHQKSGRPILKLIGFNSISEGWGSLNWGDGIETFREHYPCCRYTRGDHIIDSGEGKITFRRICAKPFYVFNAGDRFYQVMLVPDMIDRPNIDVSLLNSMGFHPDKDGVARRGSIRVEVNRRFRIILITNTEYER